MNTQSKQGILRVVIGLVGVSIAFLLFPIVMDATYSITSHDNISLFTGLSDIAKIGPLVIFVGILFGSGLSIYSGAKLLRA